MQKNTRKVIISAIITAIVLIVGLGIYQKMSSNKKSTIADSPKKVQLREVTTYNITYKTKSNPISLDGRIVPFEKIDISSKVNGILNKSKKIFKEGSYFNKGELIFTIDNTEAKFALFSQRSQLLNAITAMLPDLKFDQPLVFEKWNKYVADFNMEQATANLPSSENSKEKYFIAARNIYNLFYTIKSSETRLNDYNIYAPFSGVITAANVYPGVMISPGLKLGTLINLGQFELEANVKVADLQNIKIGQTAKLKSIDLGNTWSATVSRIGNLIDPATQYIPVYLTIKGSGLKEGLYLSGSINGNPITGVDEIPTKWMPDQSSVWVVEENKVTKRNVKVVKKFDDMVYITDLPQDTKIVAGSITGLYEGLEIKIVN
jgi:RND family efflux transporter MFP subunit